jgi:hypothetical protein
MGTLGVVFYQNFIAKKEVVVQQPKPEAEMPLVERMAFDNEIYSLEYPKEWKSKIADGDTSARRSLSITNPDQSVRVQLTVSTVGTSGPTCIPEHGLKISYYNVDRTPSNGLVDQSLYLVEAATDSPKGGYEYRIGLMPDSGSTNTAVGESSCNLGWIGLASSGVVENGNLIKPIILANIGFPKLQPDTSVPIKDMKQIKDMLSTEDYKTAVKILKSARKES